MKDSRTFQIHANVNSDHGDSALRVSITYYDEQGASYAHKTWRAHARTQWHDSAHWQTYSGLVDLARMLGKICGSEIDLEEPDEPLPFDV